MEVFENLFAVEAAVFYKDSIIFPSGSDRPCQEYSWDIALKRLRAVAGDQHLITDFNSDVVEKLDVRVVAGEGEYDNRILLFGKCGFHRSAILLVLQLVLEHCSDFDREAEEVDEPFSVFLVVDFAHSECGQVLAIE